MAWERIETSRKVHLLASQADFPPFPGLFPELSLAYFSSLSSHASNFLSGKRFVVSMAVAFFCFLT